MRGRTAAPTHRRIPHSVKQLLTNGGGQARAHDLRQLRRRLPGEQALSEQEDWITWLRGQLPPELAPHLSTVVRRALPAPRAAQLVLFADSASWCARLRYALGMLADGIRARDAAIGAIQVRVLRSPRG